MKKALKSKDVLAFNILGYCFVGILAVYCLIPFVMLISASFTDESVIRTQGYALFPPKFSTAAYQTIGKAPQGILQAYAVTIGITLVGVLSGVLLTAMTAYVLYRKDFKYRNQVAFFIFFTQMFGGGLIPWYIMCVKYFAFKNSFHALILPGLLAPFYIILMRNFMNSIPDAIVESARVDGAGDFMIFARIFLPMSTAGLATVGLFMALDYWNGWQPAMLFIEKSKMYPLQYYLYQIMSKARFIEQMAGKSNIPIQDVPQESLKMAMAAVTTGPIILLYPFVQRYFVKGITVGSVKG